MFTTLLELYSLASIGASAYGYWGGDGARAAWCRKFGCDARELLKR